MDFEFEPLEPAPTRVEEECEKKIWQPQWKCFCCQDTGKIQPLLIRRVIPKYDYNRDRLPICQLCSKGRDWLHLKDEGIIDTRITFDTCRKLDIMAREEWKRTTLQWFEHAQKRVEQGTTEISQKRNLRQRDRTQTELVLAQTKHAKARSNCEEINEVDEYD